MAKNVLFSPRVAPQMIGLGLLAALSEATIRALTDESDDDGAQDPSATYATSLRSPSVDALAERETTGDPITALLEQQSASGMWESPGRDPIEVTVEVLLILVRLGVSSTHLVHGAQATKAVGALLAAIAAAPKLDAKLAELALAALWLLSTGRRTRLAIKDAASHRVGLEALTALLGRDDDGVRAHVERIAPV